MMDEAWGQCLQQVMKHQPLLVDGLSNDYIHAPIMKYTQSWSLLMKYNFSEWANLLSHSSIMKVNFNQPEIKDI